jgi:glycine/D-amino acid oxidase-like deaminating enzyme
MPSPWPTTEPRPEHRAMYADAVNKALWLDNLERRQPGNDLTRSTDADLCIVGGGFMGLWAGLQAKSDDPARDVVLIEGETVGFGASGRNGGFVNASLTHGLSNALERFPDEVALLERLGRQNFADLVDDIRRLGIKCDLELTGSLTPVVAPYQEGWPERGRVLYERFGYDVEVFPDAASMQAEVASPLYRGGLWTKGSTGILDPAKLAFGLLQACQDAGVRVFERSRVLDLELTKHGVDVVTAHGKVRARRVVLATNAYPPLARAIRRYVVPVYDYALMTEPLSPDQKASIGWKRRQGIADGGNQFHYYRLDAADRILWGGYDVVYRFGGPVRDEFDDYEPTFARLAQNFVTTFPQLSDLRFTHRWGGAIDTCSRFSVFFGTSHQGRVAYAAGYTGLGVAATRFGARAALDLVDGAQTEVTRSRYVNTKPLPFPPEPLRSGVIHFTINRLAAADRNDGRRGVWLRMLDRVGLGLAS